MDFCPALDMANMCIQLQAKLSESGEWSSKDFWTVAAAWAQAIFSVVAIVASISISNKEHARVLKAQKSEKNLAKIDWLKKVAQCIEYCANEFCLASAWLRMSHDEDPGNPGYSESFKYLIQIVEKIDFTELPDQLSITFMIKLRKDLESASSICDRAITKQRHWPDDIKTLGYMAARIDQYEHAAKFGLNNLRAHIQFMSTKN